MRRALAILILTIAALTFVLRFNPQQPVTFAAGSAGPDGSGSAATSADTTSTVASVDGSSEATTSTTVLAATTSTTSPPTTTTMTTRVIDGSVIQTEWGPVQVEVTVAGGAITDVEVLQVPDHTNRSRQINNYVTPIYREAALQAQSARFHGVSGATITWWGYVNSMQAALDAAGI